MSRTIFVLGIIIPSERDPSQRQFLAQRGTLIALNDENVVNRILAKAADERMARNAAFEINK